VSVAPLLADDPDVFSRFQVGSPDALADEEGIIIRGRGVLSGEGDEHGSTNYDHVIVFYRAKETLVEGITLVLRPSTASCSTGSPVQLAR
jgi:hypothetical protein